MVETKELYFINRRENEYLVGKVINIPSDVDEAIVNDRINSENTWNENMLQIVKPDQPFAEITMVIDWNNIDNFALLNEEAKEKINITLDTLDTLDDIIIKETVNGFNTEPFILSREYLMQLLKNSTEIEVEEK